MTEIYSAELSLTKLIQAFIPFSDIIASGVFHRISHPLFCDLIGCMIVILLFEVMTVMKNAEPTCPLVEVLLYI